VLRNPGREGIEAVRWWTLAELRVSTEIFFPDGFAGLVEPIINGMVPSAPVIVT
jgi:hypothetical protein